MVTLQKITDGNEEAALITERIDELENLMEEGDQLRRRQFLVSSCTLMLMLIVLTVFIIGLASYFKHYPKRTLMREVIRNSRSILTNPYILEKDRGFDRKVIVLFAGELRLALQRQIPLMRKELRAEMRALSDYARNELRQKFQTNLYTRLTAETRRYLAVRKQRPDKRQELLLQQMNAELAAAVSARVFAELNPSREHIRQFRDEVEFLRNTRSYRALSTEPKELIESRLMENLLEYGIYLLNEEKGLEPTLRKGGE